MLVTQMGQVTIPKPIRAAAGVVRGSEVCFSLDGDRIVITRVASNVENDRRMKLRAAAAKVRSTLNPEFGPMGAQEIMDFLRSDDDAPTGPRLGRR